MTRRDRRILLRTAVSGLSLALVLGVGTAALSAAHSAPGAAATLARPPVRALSFLSAGERPAAPGAEVRRLAPLSEEAPPEGGPGAALRAADEETPAEKRGEPGVRLFYLGTLGLPETSLSRIARDLAALGLPYTIRGLPWKSVPADPARTDVVRRETTLEDLTEPFNREKTPVHVDPRPFRALEAALRREGFSGNLPLPLWLATLEGDAPATEVLPGDLPPLCALGELLARTESPRLRERLRAEVLARLSDEARKELLVCADFAPDVRPRTKILSPE